MMPTQPSANFQLIPFMFGAGKGEEQSGKAPEFKNGVFS